jgi:hypothetical protein
MREQQHTLAGPIQTAETASRQAAGCSKQSVAAPYSTLSRRPAHAQGGPHTTVSHYGKHTQHNGNKPPFRQGQINDATHSVPIYQSYNEVANHRIPSVSRKMKQAGAVSHTGPGGEAHAVACWLLLAGFCHR